MNHTTNYQLNQWEAADKVRRIDFNADNARIDAAIKAVDTRVDGLSGSKADQTALDALSQTVAGHTAALAGKGNCRIASGTYTGTGTTGAGNKITLTFDFVPQLVIVQNTAAQADCVNSDHLNRFMLILVRGVYTYFNYQGNYNTHISWGDNSVSWYAEYPAAQLNVEGRTYHYIALG